MATSKKFSELPAASSVGNGDLFAIAHEDALAETGYVSQKLTAAQAGQKVNGDTEYPTSLPSFPANGQNPFAALEKLNQDIIDLYPVNTASSSIANFTTSLALPLVAMSAEIVAQQASGTPTPSSPLPISGFDSVKIGQTSDYASYFRGLLLGTYDFVDLGTVDWQYSDAYKWFNPTNASFPAANVKPTPNNVVANIKCAIYETTTRNDIANDLTLNKKCCVNNGGYFIVRDLSYTDANIFKTAMSGVYLIYELATPKTPTITAEQFATLCQAFGITGETKTIALEQTVYGGVLDAKNGTATITHGFVDLGDWDWVSEDSTLSGLVRASANQVAPLGAKYLQTPICSHFEGVYTKSYSGFNNNEIAFSNSEQFPMIRARSTEFVGKTAEQIKALMNGVMFVYELATPTEITGLTGANFTTIAGEQNIFADCGDVTVSFKQGIQEYIDAKIAETQALIL